MSALRVALAGLNETGLAMLAALERTTETTVVAVGDDRPEAFRNAGPDFAAPAYTDLRSLVVEAAPKGLDLVIVAMEPFQTAELLATAAERRVPVLLKTPPARTVRETRRIIDAFEQARIAPTVARWWSHEPAFAKMCKGMSEAGHVFHADAGVTACDTADGWRGDRARSGGGVLLNSGFEVLDMLVCALGLPEAVYGHCASALPPGAPQKYDTEDAAVACLRFANATAVVSARRGAAASAWSLRFVGTDQMVEWTAKRLVVSPAAGGRSRHFRVRSALRYAPFMQALVAYLADEPLRFDSRLTDHLPTIATIEAAYLSARTGEAESPARLLERV